VFHLNNRDADRKLNLMVQGIESMSADARKYLGIKTDRAPSTFNQHLEDVKNESKTRNNIITKLAGTSWGCRANVLRTLAVALVCTALRSIVPQHGG